VRVTDGATWRQAFRWGLLLAFDDQAEWALPEGVGSGAILASSTCLAVPVLHAQDVEVPGDWPEDEALPEAEVEVRVVLGVIPDEAEFVGVLECPSGRLNVGDADFSQVLGVPVGLLALSVTREPVKFAESVTITIA